MVVMCQQLVYNGGNNTQGDATVHIAHAVSLWNYTHYTDSPSLERICASLREHGYGIEVWPTWRDEKDLFDETGRRRLKSALQGMPVTLHTTMEANTIELHKKQIDAAAAVGAGVVVIHPTDLMPKGASRPDLALTRDAVSYAHEKGVRLALENGKLAFLAEAANSVEGLGICLDVGHVYLNHESMSHFLNELKSRLIHLHIQELLSEIEIARLPGTMKDHYIPGTGTIPRSDWELLARTLHEIDYSGAAVFEIQPRRPLQTALLGKVFLDNLLR
jgi:sugar phosphate isomerase/epimerase